MRHSPRDRRFAEGALLRQGNVRVLFAAAVLMMQGIAHAAEPSNQELLDQIRTLRERVNELEEKQAQLQAATQPTPTSTPATRHPDRSLDAVTEDARRRSWSLSLSEEGSPFLGGWRKGR